MSDARCKKEDAESRRALDAVKVLSARVAELEADRAADADTIAELEARVAELEADRAADADTIDEYRRRVAELEALIERAEARLNGLSPDGPLDERISWYTQARNNAVLALEAQHITDTRACLSADRERNEARAEAARLHEQVEQLQARIAGERPVVSTEQTGRVMRHLLEALSRELGDDTPASPVIEALAVLLGVDRG